MTVFYQKDLTKKFENQDFYKDYKECKAKQGNEEKRECLWTLLHEITELQDHIQLAIPIRNRDEELAQDLTNSANAIILETSLMKGGLRGICAGGYVEDNIKKLDTALFKLNLKYKK